MRERTRCYVFKATLKDDGAWCPRVPPWTSWTLCGRRHPVEPLLYIDQVATRFPASKIVVGHGACPWVDEIHVAFKAPERFHLAQPLFFVPGGNRYLEAMRGALKDQFLFGTAYPLGPLVQTVEDCRAFNLEVMVSRKFFAENAEPLLGSPRD